LSSDQELKTVGKLDLTGIEKNNKLAGYEQFDIADNLDTRSERAYTNNDKRSDYHFDESKRMDTSDNAGGLVLSHRQHSDGSSNRDRRFKFQGRDQNGKRLQRGSNSFSLRLSQHIDNLIEGYQQNAEPRELFIPGLDDDVSDKRQVGIFDLEEDEPDELKDRKKMKKIKTLSQVSDANAETTVRGDVGTLQTSFNMLKVFIGIGILATPAGFQ